MRPLTIILALFLISSCSTLKKSMIYGGIGGGITGAAIGAGIGEIASERNNYKRSSNVAVGLATGALFGAITGIVLGNYFYNDDPENKDLKQMILPEKITPHKIENNTTDSILELRKDSLVSFFETNKPELKIYSTPNEPLPDDLKNEVMEQKVLIYELPEQYIRLKDGRTILIKKGMAKEHFYQEPTSK